MTMTLRELMCAMALCGLAWGVQAQSTDTSKMTSPKSDMTAPKSDMTTKSDADYKAAKAACDAIKARIKVIDRDQRTIKLLVRDGVSQTFRITPETEFRDVDGQRLPQGLDAPELRADILRVSTVLGPFDLAPLARAVSDFSCEGIGFSWYEVNPRAWGFRCVGRGYC